MTAEQATDTEAEEQDQQAKSEGDEPEGRLGEEIDGEERWQDDETVSDQATCPECGEPVHNLRMTCPMCGHEYKDKEYDDEEAGTEFRAGSEIDDEEVGEKVKESAGAEKTQSD
jgi:rubredoxin